MSRSTTPLIGLLAAAVLVMTGYAVSSASPLRSRGAATSVPPAYYAGTDADDVLFGTSGTDVLSGKGGNDRLYGRGGNDVLRGGSGNDRLWGGPGRDVLLGGPGNDLLYARDGTRDTVDGGPGFDQAWVDRLDVVKNVERIYLP
jgi:Ca2+-binding RTX toxin-like protein